MNELYTIAIYGASSNKVRSAFSEAAQKLGELIADQHFRLIYGGGGIGLMAAAAQGAIDHHGEVIGVIPQFMVNRQWNNPRDTQTIVTQTMHERKRIICDMADAMVALPGGIGTFEELLECLTWKQLGLHTKPVVILNTDGYYDRLLGCINYMVSEQMMRPIHQQMYTVVQQPQQVIPAIRNAPQWDTKTGKLAAI